MNSGRRSGGNFIENAEKAIEDKDHIMAY